MFVSSQGFVVKYSMLVSVDLTTDNANLLLSEGLHI